MNRSHTFPGKVVVVGVVVVDVVVIGNSHKFPSKPGLQEQVQPSTPACRFTVPPFSHEISPSHVSTNGVVVVGAVVVVADVVVVGAVVVVGVVVVDVVVVVVVVSSHVTGDSPTGSTSANM